MQAPPPPSSPWSLTRRGFTALTAGFFAGHGFGAGTAERPSVAHEVHEVRRLCDAARARGVATQLGSQRHALPGLRAGVELVRAGAVLVGVWHRRDRQLGLPHPRHPLPGPPPQTLPPSPGFYREWFDACRGGPVATCHFGYAGPLAESVPLANIAYRVQGKFAWDATALTSGRPDEDALLRREYRPGWQV